MDDTNNAVVLKTNNLTHDVQAGGQPLQILKGISFEIKGGESVAIVGASGSGKSTLLGLLAGLDRHTGGDIELAGQSLNALGEEQRAQLRAQHVGFIFQSFHLLPSLTALENVMLPGELKARDDAKELAQSLLQAVGLSHRMGHYPRQLSGGEQQRVAIARAFASEPSILFADEPTGNLDYENGQKIEQLLFDLNKEKQTTLVVVTHDPELAARCDRRLHMHDGRISEQEGAA
ncbi:ABC transporter ATP-binding protein [Maribrevibacterium harenarium]|uniref:ABC transporter ATP-binding protein n=1 Tax=Maribrevibacterium harenarium TaxID=2589817 RepID=A0A501X506_9GAMM|nr:ABC transporter ATP-binding protein [Maribrevibacterium harenarium]TPE55523.1 ABC transporter ATP-binding protein [Maribrevibacterium harenarium]